MKRLYASLAVLGLLLAGCGAPSHASTARAAMRHSSLVLDWLPNSDHGGIYTAIRRGYFRRRHVILSPQVPSSSTAQIALVAAGRADFGISYETDVLEARSRHIPVRSLMCIMQHPLDTVMSLTSSHIRRPRDLAGKSVGMAGAPSDEPIVRAMMTHDHASFSAAKMVNVGYNLLPALLAGKVDAVVGVYWTWEAIQARLRGYPVNVMRVEHWGVPNYCELVLISSDKLLRTKSNLVRSTVQALQQGYAYAAHHPVYAWQALHAADKALQRRLVLRSLRLVGPIETAARTVGYQNPAQWRHYAAWLYRNHLIPHQVNVSQAFTNRFLAGSVASSQ
ncbi:MAG: ABC transporter substrate-binding protein [Chloroflexota bacterium]